MTRAYRKFGFLVLVPLSVVFGQIYLDGPPPGFTGGFSEPTCQQCHFGNPLNDSSGQLFLTGVDDGIGDSSVVTLTVHLESSHLVVAGFQLSVRDYRGRSVGEWQPNDIRTQVIADSSGVQYVQHTQYGSSSAVDVDGSIEWKINWVAPGELPDTLVFNIAGNAANGDDSPFGDYIISKEIRIPTR